MMNHTAEQGKTRSRSFKKGLKWTVTPTSCGGNVARQGAFAVQSKPISRLTSGRKQSQASSLVRNISVHFDRT